MSTSRCEYFKQHFVDIKPQPKISADFEHQIAQWCALVTLLWSINDSSEEGHNCSLLRDLMIVLKAATEETTHNDPLSNVFLRWGMVSISIISGNDELYRSFLEMIIFFDHFYNWLTFKIILIYHSDLYCLPNSKYILAELLLEANKESL